VSPPHPERVPLHPERAKRVEGLLVLALLLSLAGCASDAKRDSAPKPPNTLTHFVTGNDADANVTALGGAILMGGSTDVDAAFQWASDRAAGGDLVVIRTTGSDGYNDYLYSDIGGFDSVETMLVTTRALAEDPYVVSRVERAEVIFLAGGDQWTYIDNWNDTPLEDAIHAAVGRGAIIGGTSAGLAVLGEIAFTAEIDTVTSAEALADPYDPLVTLDGFLTLPMLAGVVTDSHFGARDRMGRLIAFHARAITDALATSPIGIGVDEETALVIGASGAGSVLGIGNVYRVGSLAPPAHCVAGDPLVHSVEVHRLVPGDTLTFPGAETDSVPYAVLASNGALQPASPY